jgi:hypothetical protein
MYEVVMYEVNGWWKYAEQDHWKTGCDPDSGYSFSGDDRIYALSISEMLQKLRGFVGVDDDYEIELDACDEDGRVDISVMETNDSYTPTPRQIEEWKRGELALWYSTYTFDVKEVTRKQVRLRDE